MTKEFGTQVSEAEAILDIDDRGSHRLVPVAFTVGSHHNLAGENTGSLRILLAARLKGLTVAETLPLFGEYWQQVQTFPEGADHPNIRALLGVRGDFKIDHLVQFFGDPIIRKSNEERVIEAKFRDLNNPEYDAVTQQAIENVLDRLDTGRLRVSERLRVGYWVVNQWVKKAVLLSFRLRKNELVEAGDLTFYDKVPIKFCYFDEDQMRASGMRVVPPAVARHGSYLAQNVVLMPSFVNIGAYVDEGTMVDTWATVGSCAQIGKNVHLSGGVGIGGVLEPMQASPTIIEDNCFIGARSEIVEGVIVEENSVIGMGVFLSQSTPIFDRITGTTHYGRVPSGSVVVSGTRPRRAANGDEYGQYCAVIVKQVDAQTRAKTSINELLRT